MSRTVWLIATSLTVAAACRAPEEALPIKPIEPPVSSVEGIPDAPVNGTISNTQFVLRDARYIVDRRVGYAHTDIRLSAGTSETPCGPLVQPHATSVWIRLDGDAISGDKEVRLAAGDKGPWSVHYQIFENERWKGIGEGSALVSIREPGPDGRLAGGLAICFSDDKKSCVSGSFNAISCPPNLDQPVRGALPVESVPPRYRLKMFDAGLAPEDSGAALVHPPDAGVMRR